MTRIKISAAIILLLIGTSIFSGEFLDRRCGEIISLVSQAEELIEEGDAEGAFAVIGEIGERWEGLRKKAVLLIHNSKLVEADRLCARIQSLSEEQSTDLTADLAELKKLAEELCRPQ